MKLKNKTIALLMSPIALLVSCDTEDQKAPANPSAGTPRVSESEEEHPHEEVSLGEFEIDGMSVKAAQGHGNVAPGKEVHLVVTLPYQDDGQTVTRAWIGTEDRTLSTVGKGGYASSHGDYDIHAIAPDPLPEGSSWWLEIEKPDGTKSVGAIPLLRDIPGK